LGSGWPEEAGPRSSAGNRNSDDVKLGFDDVPVRGLKGLRFWELQGVEGNPFRGSIGAEGGWMGCSTELWRRLAMVAALMVVRRVRANGIQLEITSGRWRSFLGAQFKEGRAGVESSA